MGQTIVADTTFYKDLNKTRTNIRRFPISATTARLTINVFTTQGLIECQI